MSETTIQRLVNLIEKSLLDLKANSSQDFIEAAAILVHESMSGPKRRFHTTDHVFQIIDPNGDPILILAALFHDLVYFNVDGGFTERVEELIGPFITIELEQVFLRRRHLSHDPVYPIVLNVFGFKQGQLLSAFGGLNEMLSALVFARLFYPILSMRDVVAVAACLEASQPFRKDDDLGRSCFSCLEERLRKLNKSFDLGLSEPEIVNITIKAVRFANLDVSNFAFEDTAVFLDNTWKLLPENNANVLSSKVYTIKNYRAALERMETFFHRIDSTAIFHHYRNEPSYDDYQRLQKRAHKNVELAKDYLAGRLVAMAILEALCLVTGGDAPVVMLMGSRAAENVKSRNEFNDLITKVPVKLANDINKDLLGLLEYEADLVSILDFRKTPLTAFVYKCVGHEKMLRQLVIAKDFFAGKMSPERFLGKMDSYVVGSIAEVCAEMISTRRDRFLRLSRIKKLPKSKRRVA